MKNLVTIKQAADKAARDERTIQRWIQMGKITAYPDGTGRRLVVLQEVLAVEADVRMRAQNRQKQRLRQMLGEGQD